MFIFKEKMQSLSKYFAGWEENHYKGEGHNELFVYVKDDYKISFGMDWRFEVGLIVERNSEELICVEGGYFKFAKKFNKNNINHRMKKMYKDECYNKIGCDKERNNDMIDLYIEFLVENGILTKPADII